MRQRSGLVLGLLFGTALDAVLADPVKHHPVAAFGAVASYVESKLWADSRIRGVSFVVLSTGSVLALGTIAQRRLPGVVTTIATAAATWTVLGGTSLAAEASGVASCLDVGDLASARRRLPALCGRDPHDLDEPEIARATVESVAENTCDAVVAPLFWGAVCGLPGLLAYRAVNTLDAMVGHRNRRYERFGWAAARLDDLANLVPARVTALLAVILAEAVDGSPARALRTLLRDGSSHPSPNGGQCEAAFAGALGVRLGGTNLYQGRSEQRGVLGDGPPPTSRDIRRAILLSRLTGASAVILAAVTARLVGRVSRQ